MEPLKKIVKNQYFPAAAVLTAVVLFWVIAMFGGLSLLNNNQPPMATLTWMLFVYVAAVLTPLAGVLAAVDLVRRWRRNRDYARANADADARAKADAVAEAGVSEEVELAEEPATAVEPAAEPFAEPQPASVPREESRQAAQTSPVPKQPAMNHQPTQHQPAQKHHPKGQPLKKPAQAKQRKKAA